MEQQTAETLKSLAVTTIRSIRQPVASLSGGQRQSVAVAKAVQWNSNLVILDEPTAALGVAQTEQVLALVQAPGRAGARGRDHLAQPARHLRDGQPHHGSPARANVGVYERTKTTQEEVVHAITAGVPTSVAGIPSTQTEPPRDLRGNRGRRRRTTPLPRRRRRPASGAGDTTT